MLWWTYQQLRSGSAKTRLTAVEKLARSAEADTVEPLIFALKDKDLTVRCLAAKALVRCEDRRAVEPLLQMLRDKEPLARTAAAETLGQLRDPVAVNWLVGLLRDPDPGARAAVSRSLQQLGWRPGDDSQRVLQILAMGNLRQVAELGPQAIDPLLEMLRTGAPDKQFSAVRALGEINDPRVVKAMIEALGKPNPGIQIAALGTLERFADPSSCPAIERLLKDSNANVRGAVVEALARCGGERAVPALIRTLKDTSWDVRNATVKALGVLGPAAAAAVDGISTLLRDPDRDVRESAVIALGRIGARGATGPLILSLLDAESIVRSAATVSLQQVCRNWEQSEALREVLPEIKNALNHSEYWVRHSAIKLFEQLKLDPETVEFTPPPLPPAASPAERMQAAFPILADLLFDRDRDLRLAAAEAFGHLRDQRAAAILGAAVNDTDHAVQTAAKQALAALN